MTVSIEAGLLTREKAVSHIGRTRNGYSSENVCQVSFFQVLSVHVTHQKFSKRKLL